MLSSGEKHFFFSFSFSSRDRQKRWSRGDVSLYLGALVEAPGKSVNDEGLLKNNPEGGLEVKLGLVLKGGNLKRWGN